MVDVSNFSDGSFVYSPRTFEYFCELNQQKMLENVQSFPEFAFWFVAAGTLVVLAFLGLGWFYKGSNPLVEYAAFRVLQVGGVLLALGVFTMAYATFSIGEVANANIELGLIVLAGLFGALFLWEFRKRVKGRRFV